ncbi:prolactin-releasing peptide receptor-like [Glandiceps talaboti]
MSSIGSLHWLAENGSNSSMLTFGERRELPGTILLRNISWLTILLYSFVFIIGSIGNALLVGTVICYRSLHNVTNFFIANLAASDFIMCIFCIPWTLAHSLMDDWIFGESMCRFVPMVQAISVYVSVMSHVVIAIDRYFAIMHPLRARLTLTACSVIIAVSWLIACCLASPIAAYTHQFDLRSFGLGIVCFELWPTPSRRTTYGISLLLIQYITPLIIVTVIYTRMSLNLNRRVAPGVITDEQEYVETRRKQRTNRLLVAVIASFALSWLPFNVVMVVTDINVNLIDSTYFNVTFLFCHILAMSSTCYNPFIYAWLHSKFHGKVKNILPCWRRSHGKNDVVILNIHCNHDKNSDSSERKLATISSQEVATFHSQNGHNLPHSSEFTTTTPSRNESSQLNAENSAECKYIPVYHFEEGESRI